MRYFFEFITSKGELVTKEVKPESARDIIPGARIILNTFFPEYFTGRTYFHLREQEVEKDKITYKLTKDYKYEASTNNDVQESTDRYNRAKSGASSVLPREGH